MADPTLTLFYEFAKNKALTPSQGLGPTLGITRTTEKRVFGSDKLLQTVASGVAGFDHDPVNATSLGLSVEEARTNLAIYSSDTSNAAWVASNITKETTSVTDPTGAANTSVRLTASAANGTLLQTVTSAIDDYSYAVFMKRVTGTGDIDLTVDNGTTWTTKTLTSDWTRFDVSDASETNPVFGVRIVTDTDAIDFWGSDLNKNTTFPTSHAPTVASSVTRNADVVSTTDVGWLNASAGTIYIESSKPTGAGTSSDMSIDINNGSSAQRVAAIARSDNGSQLFVNSAGTQASLVVTSGYPDDGSTRRQVSSYALNDFEHYANGTRSGTGDQLGTVPTSLSQLNVGASTVLSETLNGHIREVRYYNVRKVNQFLEDLSKGLINEDSLSFSRNLARPLARNLARTY